MKLFFPVVKVTHTIGISILKQSNHQDQTIFGDLALERGRTRRSGARSGANPTRSSSFLAVATE